MRGLGRLPLVDGVVVSEEFGVSAEDIQASERERGTLDWTLEVHFNRELFGHLK